MTNLGPQVKSIPTFLIFSMTFCEGLDIDILFGVENCCGKIKSTFNRTMSVKKIFFMRVGWLEGLIIWFENNGYFFNKDLFFY